MSLGGVLLFEWRQECSGGCTLWRGEVEGERRGEGKGGECVVGM